MNQISFHTPDGERGVPSPPPSKREVMLAAATELFLDLGYGATSINALVAKVGGSKATIYGYFSNKQALFEAVAERVLHEHMTALKSDQLKNMSLTEGLTLMGQKLLELVTSDHHIRLSRLVIAETPNFPEIGRAYHDRGPALATQQIAAFLKGENKLADPQRAASHYTAMLLHHIFLARLCGTSPAPSAVDIQSFVADAVTDFIKLYDLIQETDI